MTFDIIYPLSVTHLNRVLHDQRTGPMIIQKSKEDQVEAIETFFHGQCIKPEDMAQEHMTTIFTSPSKNLNEKAAIGLGTKYSV